MILGLNVFHGDSSAALFRSGALTCAVEEERFNRVKHWAGLPLESARWCLGGDVPEHVAISRDPSANLVAKLLRATLHPGNWNRYASRAKNGIRVARVSNQLIAHGISSDRTRFHFVEHHRAHLASAFFCSPFEESAVVSVDGFGDFSSVMWGVGYGHRIHIQNVVHFPHSLGLFYTAFTQFLGFPKYGDEYKMMGMAAYGEPRFVEKVRDVVSTRGGICRLNLAYFTHHSQGVDMTWYGGEPKIGPTFSRKMTDVFGPPRIPRSEILPRHFDLAASVQAVLEENYFALLNHVQKETRQKTVCLAGGVALNCAANGRVFEKTGFQDVYIQPAAHDAGTSIGAALYVQHQVLRQPRSFTMRHVYYGPEYSDAEIQHDLHLVGAVWHKLTQDDLVRRTAAHIADGLIVGWFQGRMEFGPRALGNRSILADPRRKDMKDILNSRIKYREPFRPFCPSVLAECTGEYFDVSYPSPFMVMAYQIKADRQHQLPAVTHGDGTGRLQTVDRDVNPLYWRLIRRFGEITGVPVLLNTSFNENEPIVNTPAQALDCFLRTKMDVLTIGSYLLLKPENLHVSANRSTFAEIASSSTTIADR